ncbi:MAG: EAL domain-containing protein [Gammaproteobacteria bacterium]
MEEPNIIPILVVSDTQNKAEMLNGLLRGEGLAVHPQWINSLAKLDTDKAAPELVFYFDDINKPTLEEVIAATRDMAAALIVVSTKHDQERAAAAINHGASAQVCLAETALLAGVARREHRSRDDRAKLRVLKHKIEQNNRQLRNLLAGTHNAIAYTQEGLITSTNPSWVEYFGYSDSAQLVDSPIMDLFSKADQDTLKKKLRLLKRNKSVDGSIKCTAIHRDGSEFLTELTLDTTEVENEKQIQFTIAGDKRKSEENAAALKHIDEVEAEKSLLLGKLETLKQYEPDSRLLWPTTFATIAAERVNRPLAGAARALVAFRPANLQEAISIFGPLGLSEAGASIATMISPLLEEEDIATRIDQLTILTIVNRADDQKIRAWSESVINALGEHIFETSSRSSLLGFAAGIAPIDRIRRLEQLTHQAVQSARGESGSVNLVAPPAEITTVDTDDSGWSALISEALDERRFAIALSPIEDLSNTNRFYAATARLLDREGKEIVPDVFMEPAARLGLKQSIEQRLVGHSFIALMRLMQTDKNARIIVSLSSSVMKDTGLINFLSRLIDRTQTQLPEKSLIFELSVNDTINHVISVEKFIKEIHPLNCGFGVRDYVPGNNADKVLDKLSIDSLRIGSNCIAELQQNEELAKRIRKLILKLEAEHCYVIASGVNDANLMAQLYNLGLSTIEGDAIGGAEIFSSQNPMFEALYSTE